METDPVIGRGRLTSLEIDMHRMLNGLSRISARPVRLK